MFPSPRDLAQPLRNEGDLGPLLDVIGDKRVVCLGEASHGTAEDYTWRAAITRRLLEEKDFAFVAVEGDWPDCYAVNQSVRLRPGAAADPREALARFDRWPSWMWANEEVVAFAHWLRRRNALRPSEHRAGFYGLDVYSLWESIHELLTYLQEHEPQHVEQALAALRCLEPYGEDPQQYAWGSRFSPASCESAVVALLAKICSERAPVDEGDDGEARFNAEQNALSAAGAEHYYRAMAGGSEESWNIRDTHMVDTLDRLLGHTGGRAVLWEHNTHVGDARATDMARSGLVNVGQLVRERYGRDQVALVGFGSYRGSVIAGRSWGAPMRVTSVPPARAGSLEHLLHEEVGRDALFVFQDGPPPEWLAQPLDHRAIGVVYVPEHERWGNYVRTVLGERYDAFLYLDHTSALHPLHLDPDASGEEATWPYAV